MRSLVLLLGVLFALAVVTLVVMLAAAVVFGFDLRRFW